MDSIFAEIASAITIVAEDIVQPDDRRAPRFKAQTQIPITSWDDPSQQWNGHIRDFSPGGIGILQTRRMDLDQQFIVELPREKRTEGSAILLVLYQTIYWEPLAQDLYAIGAQFQRLTTLEELNSQMDKEAAEPVGIIARFSALIRKNKMAS